MPILECPEAGEETKPGDTLEVDLEAGIIKNVTQGKTYKAQSFPPFMRQIIQAGGLMPWVKRRLAEAKA